MKRSESGFTLIELILAMFIAGIFLFLLGSTVRHMVSSVDTEHQLMTVEQDAKKIHEYVSRVMRDASVASVQFGGTCGILRFSTLNFGGSPQMHHWYVSSSTESTELYEESDFDCANGNLFTTYYLQTSSQLSLSNGIFEWAMSLTDGIDTIPVRIVAAPRNL